MQIRNADISKTIIIIIYFVILCFCVFLAYQVILKLVAGAQEYQPEGPHCHGSMAHRPVQP